MKIIFLDIDGVLNHQLMYSKEDDKIKVMGWDISKSSVAVLNKLTDITGAQIVVSSTWRLLNKKEALFDALKNEAGITGNLLDITPNLGVGNLRGNEILHWIKANTALVGKYHEYKSYIILDDDSDMLLWQKDNYLAVDPFCGLTERTVYLAKRILLP